jgi:hypothetical protein
MRHDDRHHPRKGMMTVYWMPAFAGMTRAKEKGPDRSGPFA